MARTPSFKQLQIDKANTQMIVIISLTVFVTVFALVSMKSLVSRQLYQSRVIESREKARDQLAANIESTAKLSSSYEQFIRRTPNLIGGNPSGLGDRDGDNAKLVLDALPSSYDFPALTSSVEKLARVRQLSIGKISGTDQESKQQGQTASEPKPVEMPFVVEVTGPYQNINDLVLDFEKSIRPFKISKMSFKGNQAGSLTLEIDAKSYYQPAKNLQIKKEIVQ